MAIYTLYRIDGSKIFQHECGSLHERLREAVWTGVSLARVDLRGADLRRLRIPNAYLRGADLRFANLEEADLGGAILRDADLGWANLGGTNLRKAILDGANLEEAYIPGTRLRKAILEADFTGSTWQKATILRY